MPAKSKGARLWLKPARPERGERGVWVMQGGARTWDAAEFFGMSEKVLLKTYGHHHPDHQAGVLAAIGRR